MFYNSFINKETLYNRINNFIGIFILLLSVSLITSCNLTNNGTHTEEFEYSFEESDHDFEAFYTGYNVGWDDNMEFDYGYRNLPEPLDTTKMGHFIAASNRSDDVKMLFRRQVEGLEPNTEYSAQFTVRFATNVASGCAGIGGAPGEAVRVIASASSQKPEAFDDDGYYRLNLQYMNENPSAWYNSRIIGDIANSVECEDADGSITDYEIKEVTSTPGQDRVVIDDQGNAWLMFGTRSGFEGRTALFYTYFEARLTH